MLLLPRSVRVYVATYPVSLRKSFDGLSNEVAFALERDPLSGHVFVFINRRKTQVKLLLWTRGGYTIVHKRLEKGRFSFVKQVEPGAKSVQIDVHELSMLLEGLQPQSITRSSTLGTAEKPTKKPSRAHFLPI
jgi:transposase